MEPKGRTFTRRSILRGLCAAGVSLPLFPSLGLWANPPKAPKRLILFYTPNGVATKTWFPQGSESQFSFQKYGGLGANDAHPLEAFKQKLIVLENVGMEQLSKLKQAGDHHAKGTGQLFTGESLSYRDGKLWASHESIDQYVADYFVQTGQAGRFRSIEAGVFNVVNEVGGRISYRKGGVPVTPQTDPYQLHAKLFAGRLMDPKKLKLLLGQRKSILDGARSELNSLKLRLNAPDRSRLDQHLTSIREIERQLSIPIPTSCTPPKLDADMDPIDPTHYPRLAEAQIKLIAMAIKCDLTRVASIMWDQSGGKIKFKWLGLGVTAEHHTIGHGGQDSAHYGPALRKIDLWYCQQFAALCKELDDVKDSEGKSLLDHSLLVWGSELGDPRFHKHDNMPFLLAGGAGHFQMGRYLKYDPAQKVSHNQLLVSICHAMGASQVKSFGNAQFQGPLARL